MLFNLFEFQAIGILHIMIIDNDLVSKFTSL